MGIGQNNIKDVVRSHSWYARALLIEGQEKQKYVTSPLLPFAINFITLPMFSTKTTYVARSEGVRRPKSQSD